MSNPPIDPLKFAAYGVKNPTQIKEEKIQSSQAGSKGFDLSPKKRYYPKGKDGNYDEWAAMLKNQNETANKLK